MCSGHYSLVPLLVSVEERVGYVPGPEARRWSRLVRHLLVDFL